MANLRDSIRQVLYPNNKLKLKWYQRISEFFWPRREVRESGVSLLDLTKSFQGDLFILGVLFPLILSVIFGILSFISFFMGQHERMINPFVGGAISATVGLIVYRIILAYELKSKRRQREGSRELPTQPKEIDGHVLAVLRKTIDEHQRQVIGDGSEFSRLETKLVNTLAELTEGIGYFSQRVKDGEESFEHDIQMATEHHAEFSRALESLRRQKDSVIQYFELCRGRLGAIGSQLRDALERERLANIVDNAPQILATARTVGERTVVAFLDDIRNIQRTLTQVGENTQVGLPLDDAHFRKAARQLVADEEAHTRAIGRLVATLTPAR